MNAAICNLDLSVAIGRNVVDRVIGVAAAVALVRIDHDELSFGIHWRWSGGQQVFTADGLDAIAAHLSSAGFVDSARALADETRRRNEAALRATRWDLRAELAES